MDWPESLPLPDHSLAAQTGASVIRTTMETGRVRQRDRFGIILETYDVQWTFLSDEYTIFKGFFNFDITRGLDWFNIALPDAGILEAVPVRFVGAKFSRKYIPFMQWQISAQLEAMVEQSIPDPELDIMPLLRQDVIEVTESFTLDMSYQNKLICCNPSEGETLTITLPKDAGFTTVFSCGFCNEGLGDVVFAGETGVVIDSPEGALRIFRRHTPVTATYRAANRFKVMGSLY